MEDFVPFELAKKLNKKGFNEDCYTVYNTATMRIERSLTTWKGYKGVILAPAISQVLKWLRDNKILVIPIPSYFNAEGVCVSWDCDIWVDDNYEHCLRDKKTYEEAVFAGIEYVLDNLI